MSLDLPTKSSDHFLKELIFQVGGRAEYRPPG